MEWKTLNNWLCNMINMEYKGRQIVWMISAN